MSGSNAGKHATHHFKHHKLSSILLALTVPFLLCGLMGALQTGYQGFIDWIGSPFGALVLLVFITVGIFHSRTSMSELILDYTSSEASCAFFLRLSTLACLVFWLVGTLAILKIWLGA
ncbi:MAG: hypothetical protein COA69_12405 [Robiginitomaculum sp.]|nr:MAG: hypothetical protein COA69_12405 [Robiginitomaculum sp.]